MGVYFYRCGNCRGEYNFLQKVHTRHRCPVCSGPLIEAEGEGFEPAISQWYVADYRNAMRLSDKESEDKGVV